MRGYVYIKLQTTYTKKMNATSTTALDDARSFFANGVHRRLNVLRRYDRNDGGIDNRHVLDSIEEEFVGNATTHVFGHHSTRARGMRQSGDNTSNLDRSLDDLVVSSVLRSWGGLHG